MTLHDALVRVLKGKRTDEGRAKAVISLLGLKHDDVLVDQSDLAHLLAYVDDSMSTAQDLGYVAQDEDGNLWDDEEMEEVVRIRRDFFNTLSRRYKTE